MPTLCSRMEQPLPDLPSETLRFADLRNRTQTPFELKPNAAERDAIATELEVSQLKKLNFEGALHPDGQKDWLLKGALGATVIQPCVATLEPVTTRIDEKVQRRYIAEFELPDGLEVEMPEDDSAEGLPVAIDLYEVLIEQLALALPAFPRSDAAEIVDLSVSEPGVTPMSDDEAKPFAGLGALKAKLEKKATE